MSFSTKLQRYFTTLFISIIQENSTYVVFVKVVKNGKIKKRFNQTFDINSDEDKLDLKMKEYIFSLQEKYNYVYLSLLLNSMGQGAINGTSDKELEKSHVDPKNVKTVKFKTWLTYVSYIDISWIQKIYTNVGLDLIYSPFVVLYDLLGRYKLKNKPTLYILNQENSVTVGIFKGETLYFGAFYNINKEDALSGNIDVDDWENESEETLIKDLSSLKNEDKPNEELTNLDDFSDLEELNTGLDDEGFSDIQEKRSEDFLSDSKIDDASIEDIELYGRDLEIYKFLNKAIEEYYKNDIYESDFIEEAIIFDGYNISQEMIDSIENDMILDLKMHKVDIAEVVCDLSMRDIYG